MSVEVEFEKAGRQSGADRDVQDGWLRSPWRASGELVVSSSTWAPVARMLLAGALRLAWWTGFLPWPARHAVTWLPRSFGRLPQSRPAFIPLRVWS